MDTGKVQEGQRLMMKEKGRGEGKPRKRDEEGHWKGTNGQQISVGMDEE